MKPQCSNVYSTRKTTLRGKRQRRSTSLIRVDNRVKRLDSP
jgi:hypothetical protein